MLNNNNYYRALFIHDVCYKNRLNIIQLFHVCLTVAKIHMKKLFYYLIITLIIISIYLTFDVFISVDL